MQKIACPARPGKGFLFIKLLLIMKLTLTVILLATFQTFAFNGFSQQRIDLNLKSRTISSVLKYIETHYDYHFFYSDSVALNNNRIDIRASSATIDDVMQRLLTGTSFSYKKMNHGLVVIVGRENQRADHTVQGTVTDANGQPLEGVSIIEKGTSNGTTTSVTGTFSITVKDDNAVLLISAVGYVNQEVRAKDAVKIVLKSLEQQMSEVVVVGYGSQRKKDLTGAISSVSGERINKIPSTNLGEMLRGAVPGLQVTMGSAAPGGSSNILIRGRRSLSGDNGPLFIVDGVPMASIDDVNASDISSVEVLKDAAAQSVYGARSANGVILVTTKRGTAGKMKIDYNAYIGQQRLNRNFSFYNGEEWAAYRKEAFYNANGYYDESEAFSDVMLEVLYAGKSVDWEDLMISPALQHKHDLSVQSGNDKTKYALSLGYFYQDGLVEFSDFKRLTGRFNIDHKLTRTVSIGSNISYTKSWRRMVDGSFNSFITMPPLAKVYNDDGSLREDVTEAGESHYNPLWNIRNSNNNNQTDRLLVNMFVDWKIAKGISYRINGSMSDRVMHSNSYLGVEHTTGRNNNGVASVGVSFNKDYLLENILNFNKRITNDHVFDATLMQSINTITWKNLGLNGTNFPNDDLGYNGIGSANEYGLPTWELADRTLLSYLGRLRYNFRDKYLFSIAMRADGSSVFGKNNKYGFFPAASAAWRIIEEPFLNKSKWVSNLKLRLSYGQVGNQGISPYTTLGLTDRYITEFGSTAVYGYLPGPILWNPNLRWETSTTANLGIDFGFLHDRITGVVELYNTETTDLLVERALAQTSGYARQIVNLGQVRNRGLEASINVIALQKKDWTVSVNLMYTMNRNKIERIDGTVDASGKPNNDVNNNWFIGQPMNVYYDYAFDGIWQIKDDITSSHMPTAKPGNIRVKDIDGDNQVTVDDRVIMQRDPKWIGSFGTQVTYRNWSLSADLYISKSGMLYNSYLATFANGGDMTGKRNGIRRNFWTAHNPSNEAPAPNMNQPPAYISALAYENATYTRLRNVTLGYDFGREGFISRLGLSRLRAYTTLNNIWTNTDVHAYGPEQNAGAYPEPVTILFGINVSL
jgi:TonB-linked outer membrane protein, SusC/RagA family